MTNPLNLTFLVSNSTSMLLTSAVMRVPKTTVRLFCLLRMWRCIAECVAWVWHGDTHQCALKAQYDSSRKIECEGCVAYAENSGYYVYSTTSQQTGPYSGSDWTLWERDDEKIWMPEYVAALKCKFTNGYDQPEEYNLGEPMELPFSYLCCNECAKKTPGDVLFCSPDFNRFLQTVRLGCITTTRNCAN